MKNSTSFESYKKDFKIILNETKKVFNNIYLNFNMLVN